MNKKEVLRTEEELMELCTDWQEILNLQFWRIGLRVCRATEMKLERVRAECSFEVRTATALISIVDPLDSNGFVFPFDMEQSLVHELLHLHFAPFDSLVGEDSVAFDMLERAVDMIATALVDLKRKGLKDECQELTKSLKKLKLKPKVG